MNVLMFGWEFPPFNSGGLGVACSGLARALASRNVSIDFVLPQKVDVTANFLRFIFASNKSIKFHPFTSPLYPYISSSIYQKLLLQNGGSMYGQDLFSEVVRYAKEGGRIASSAKNIDVIHAHDWLSFGAGIEAKKKTRTPLVVHVHATEFDRTGGRQGHPQVLAMEKEGMEIADRVVAVSHFTKNIIEKFYNINPAKVGVVHNGIDPQQYNTNSSKLEGMEFYKKLGYKVVLFVGRLTLSKGVDFFLDSAKKCLEINPKIVFVIAGSGEMERQLIEQAARIGISDKVLFAGFVRGDKLSQIYRSADLFVMPSVSEPFGLTALESLLHKTPVIISKQSGVSEVLTHALKVDFWDVDELVNKIISVLSHRGLKKTLAENGYKDALDATWEKAAIKLNNIYNQLI